MRIRLDNLGFLRRTGRLGWLAGSLGLALMVAAPAPRAKAQAAPPQSAEQAPAQGGAETLHGLPPSNYPTSPHRGVIDGWTGKPIPCRCRFAGKSFELGSIVCMTTHVGTVLTRCDIFENNTSWMPSRQPCTPAAGS